MIPYETIRGKIMTRLNTFHTTYFPTMKIDYPDLRIVDPEKDDNFIKVELDLNSEQLDLSARRCLRIHGHVILSHYRRCGGGLKAFTTYTDTLFDYLGLKTLDGVTYYEVKPYNKQGLPGFDSTMNSVPFQFDYFA